MKDKTSFETSMFMIKKSKTRKTILVLVVFTQNASRESPLNRQMKVSSDDMKQLFCFASSNEKLQNENCFVYLTTTAATRALNLANVLVTFWIIYEVGATRALVISSFEHFLQPRRKKKLCNVFHLQTTSQKFLVLNFWVTLVFEMKKCTIDMLKISFIMVLVNEEKDKLTSKRLNFLWIILKICSVLTK